MSTRKKENKKTGEKKETGEWNRRAKEIWLAGLGALSAVEEGGSKLFKSLVDRGTEFEKKRKQEIDEMWEEVSDRYREVGDQVGDSIGKAEKAFEKNIKAIISGMGIPTRKEVEELSGKVDALNAKLDKLQKKQVKGASGKKASGSGGKKTGKE